jgi:hypothetical protein
MMPGVVMRVMSVRDLAPRLVILGRTQSVRIT